VTQERRGRYFSAVIDLLDRMSNIVTAVNIYDPVRDAAVHRKTRRRAFAAFSYYLSPVIVVVVRSNLASLSRKQPPAAIIQDDTSVSCGKTRRDFSEDQARSGEWRLNTTHCHRVTSRDRCASHSLAITRRDKSPLLARTLRTP